MKKLAALLLCALCPPWRPPPSPSRTRTTPVPGSLRQAILDANGDPGRDTIAFNIPGAGVHTITPATALPAITDDASIDGYTPAGAAREHRPGRDQRGPPDRARRERRRRRRGLNLGSSGGSTIQGLVDQPAGRTGCPRGGRRAHTLRGNFVGTDPTGTSTARQRDEHRRIAATGATVLGGPAPADRNLISGSVLSARQRRHFDRQPEWRDPGQPHRYRRRRVRPSRKRDRDPQRGRRRRPHRRDCGGRRQRHLRQRLRHLGPRQHGPRCHGTGSEPPRRHGPTRQRRGHRRTSSAVEHHPRRHRPGEANVIAYNWGVASRDGNGGSTTPNPRQLDPRQRQSRHRPRQATRLGPTQRPAWTRPRRQPADTTFPSSSRSSIWAAGRREHAHRRQAQQRSLDDFRPRLLLQSRLRGLPARVRRGRDLPRLPQVTTDGTATPPSTSRCP